MVKRKALRNRNKRRTERSTDAVQAGFSQSSKPTEALAETTLQFKPETASAFNTTDRAIVEDIVVSVIVPVYNTEKYLEESLGCIVNQTLKNIEIICVDDGSTDGSLPILNDFAAKDPRIKILKQQNKGAGAARNFGLSQACGKYSYFYDSDDLCELTLLEETVKRAKETDADIVAFNFTRLHENGTSERRRGIHTDWLPQGIEVFNYNDCPDRIMSIINPTPWNKLYKTSFLLENNLHYDEIPSTNDIAFAAVSVASAKRIAFVEKDLYRYRVGHVGTITSTKLTRLDDRVFAISSAVAQSSKLPYFNAIRNSIRRFAVDNYVFSLEHYIADWNSDRCKDFYTKIHNYFSSPEFDDLKQEDLQNVKLYLDFMIYRNCDYNALRLLRLGEDVASVIEDPVRANEVKKAYSQRILDRVNDWSSNVPPENKSEVFQELVKRWEFSSILPHLAAAKWDDVYNIAKDLNSLDFFKCKSRCGKKPLTIASYCEKLNNGGLQRVVADLCNMWSEMKDENGEPLYHVVVITDEHTDDVEEYKMNSSIAREYLPRPRDSAAANYKARFEAWQRALTTHGVDIVVYNTWWATPCNYWDVLSIKGHPLKPACVFHLHTFAVRPYGLTEKVGVSLSRLYGIADGVVTLSECDRRFVSAFSDNVKCIPNPTDFDPRTTETSAYEPDILVWCGRIEDVKRPLDLVRMMDYVVRERPNAKLYMVGTGNERLMDKIKTLIEQHGLQNNIALPGFTLDVASYYKKASLTVCASEYEGFCLSLTEAMGHGLPVVTYDLPNLTIIQDGRGVITVPQERPDLMAKAVIELLADPERCRAMGESARELITELADVDLGKEWQNMFDSIGTNGSKAKLDHNEEIIYHYLNHFNHKVHVEFLNQRSDMQRRLDALQPLKNITTGRFDIKLNGKNVELALLENTDKAATVTTPAWIQKGGKGYMVESFAGKIALKFEAKTAGKFEISLKAHDTRDPNDNTKRVPLWVDFHSCKLNGKEELAGRTPVWHDKPRKIVRQVKAGEVITAEAEWTPHLDDRYDALNQVQKAKYEAGIKQLNVENVMLQKELSILRRDKTARIDIKLNGKNADIAILKTRDAAAAKVTSPAFIQQNGKGYVIESYAGKMKLAFEIKTDGELSIALKGVDVRRAEDPTQRVPCWIDYTSFKFNGKDEMTVRTPLWHDKTKTYRYHVKAGEIVLLETTWLQHNPNECLTTTERAKLNELRAKMYEIEHSNTYRCVRRLNKNKFIHKLGVMIFGRK